MTTTTMLTLLLVSLQVLAAGVAVGYWILKIVREIVGLLREIRNSDDKYRDGCA